MAWHRHARPGPLIIIGGGLSGSLLVTALAGRHLGPIEVIDRQPDPLRGRTWATFTPSQTSRSGRTYGTVIVRTPVGQHRLALDEHVYEVIESESLARDVRAALAAAQGSQRRRDVPDGEDLETGESWVFDSRQPSCEPDAWMHFCGWHVEAAEDCFDPAAVTLMDLTVPQRGGLRFGYVLPTTERAALVELTAVSASYGPLDVETDLRSYVEQLAPLGWRVAGQEHGSIPLTARRRRGHRGETLPIGTAAGMVRASSGYGLPSMRRDAQVIAAELAAGRRPRGWRRPIRHVLMDAVFLEVAVSDPGIAVIAFDRLFSYNPVDRVVRFLDDDSTLLEDAQMIATLPVMPFLAAAARRAGRRIRRR